MSYVHYRPICLRNIFVIIIFFNCLSKCNCLDILNETSDLSSNSLLALVLKDLSGLEDIVTLPKNHVFTADEISNNEALYLAGQQNEDAHLNGTQLIQKYGYSVEEHFVTTSDGYVLAMYRIPGNGPVVFLMHGILASYVSWIMATPVEGLAFRLAAQGYDVWMGNARGNTFSKKNERLSSSQPEFWDFSFHETGTKDLPVMIDYVLQKTGKIKLTYVGYSQGTASFFVLCSKKPEYNDKIDLMISLSSIAFMKHMTSPLLRIAAKNEVILYALARALGLNEILPNNNFKKLFSQVFCGNSLMATLICYNTVLLLAGFSYDQVNYKQAPVIFSHNPAGGSVKQLAHLGQLVNSGYFREFDHGLVSNFRIYGSATPPSYPVEKITVPIYIFQSEGDWLSSPTDVETLRSKLKNVVGSYIVPLRSFNHVDYVWAKDIKTLLNDKVLSVIEQYSI